MSGRIMEVIGLFLAHKRGVGGNLTSDGKRLLSYGMEIATWKGDCIELTPDSRRFSRTTSRHRDLLRSIASLQGVEVRGNGNSKMSGHNQIMYVILAFLDHKRGVGGSLTSDGERLLSYGMEIAKWMDEYVELTPDSRGVSRTTSRHRSLLRDIASLRGVEVRGNNDN